MYILYSLFLVVWGLLLSPAFLYRAWRRGKTLPGMSERMGKLPESLRSNGGPCIWFHSCSVGETLSIQPLADTLHERFPEARLAFSTITKTGRQVAEQRFSVYGQGRIFYFPIDLASIDRRVLDWIKPSLIVIVDTEIWPNLLKQAQRRGIPVALVNGRISAASFRYYRMARPVLSRVFRNYRSLMMQSDEDGARIIRMGALREQVSVPGNLKFDRDLAADKGDEAVERTLNATFGFSESRAPLIVAGSTHSGEEETLLETLRRIRKAPGLEGTRLLLAPRHPERFEEVAGLIEANGFRLRRRTAAPSPASEADVFLLDSVGELATAYRFATIVFVGGTLGRRGGHSIMEPALHAKPIVIGPSMENFRSILDEFVKCGAVRQIAASDRDRELQREQLTHAFATLLHDENERNILGRTAFSILEKNRGATRRIAERVSALFREAIGEAGDGIDGSKSSTLSMLDASMEMKEE